MKCFLSRHYKKASLYIDDLYTIAFPDDYPEPGMMQHSSPRLTNIMWICLFIKNCFSSRHYKKDFLYIDDLYTVAFPDDYSEPGMMQNSSQRLTNILWICLFIKESFLCRHYKKDSLYIEDLYTVAFPNDYPEPGMMQNSSQTPTNILWICLFIKNCFFSVGTTRRILCILMICTQ